PGASRHPSALPARYSSSAVLPTPASPHITSTVLRPPRTCSSNSSSTVHSRHLPRNDGSFPDPDGFVGPSWPFTRPIRPTPSPIFAGIAAAPDVLSLVYTGTISTRSTIRGHSTVIFCTMVLADTLVSGRDQRHVECCGDSHQFGERVDSHLPHNPASMGLHRDLTDAEPCCDLFVQQARDDQCHGLPFAWRERRVAIPKGAQFGLVSKYIAAALYGLTDDIQQHITAEWLGQELYRPSLHRLHCRRHVAITCDEDDRHVCPIDDAFLEIETIDVGKRQIE